MTYLLCSFHRHTLHDVEDGSLLADYPRTLEAGPPLGHILPFTHHTTTAETFEEPRID